MCRFTFSTSCASIAAATPIDRFRRSDNQRPCCLKSIICIEPVQFGIRILMAWLDAWRPKSAIQATAGCRSAANAVAQCAQGTTATRTDLSAGRRGGRYFLSRPRRFGKSLLPDAIKMLFEGRERLFQGLGIDDPLELVGPTPIR